MADDTSLSSFYSIRKALSEGSLDTEEAIQFGSVMYGHVKAIISSFYSIDAESEFSIALQRPKPIPSIYVKNWFREGEEIELPNRVWISSYFDLGGSVEVFVNAQGLNSSIQALQYSGITGEVTVNAPLDLTAYLGPVPTVSLNAMLVTIPYHALQGTIGAHLPENLTGSISPNMPVDLTGFLRKTEAGDSDLNGSLNQVGCVQGLNGRLNTLYRQDLNLNASLLVRCPVDLKAYIHGFSVNDLGAFIQTQRILDLRGIIKGVVVEAYYDLGGVLYAKGKANQGLPVDPIKAIVSTHTSDFPYNLDKLDGTFPSSSFLLGTKCAGAKALRLEPVFGEFPDLHASINASAIKFLDLGAALTPIQPGQEDLPATLAANPPYINIGKLSLKMRPLSDLPGSLNPTGSYTGLTGIIRGLSSSQTGTSPDAKWASTSVTRRIIIGSSAGVVIPDKVTNKVDYTSFVNDHDLPDLRGSINGWNLFSLSASINSYPFSGISGYLLPLDLTHTGNLKGSVESFNVNNLTSDVNSVGEFDQLTGSLNVAGGTGQLTGYVLPGLEPLSYNLIKVSTKPFVGLGATVNYSEGGGCMPSSKVQGLSGYVQPLSSGYGVQGSNLSASVETLRKTLQLGANITPVNITRIRTISLEFRPGTRNSKPLKGIITPIYKDNLNLSASIYGKSHESDLSASVDVKNYSLGIVPKTDGEHLANLTSGKECDVLLSFRSGVSSYIFEDLTSILYKDNKGKWVISLKKIDSDGTLNSAINLEDITGFNTVDEAIRNAIVFLSEKVNMGLSGSLTPSGSVNGLNGFLNPITTDNFKDLSAKIVSVTYSPDLASDINTGNFSSSYLGMLTKLVAVGSQVNSLTVSILPVTLESLTASLTPIP